MTFGDFIVHDTLESQQNKPNEKKDVDYRRGFVLWLVVLVGFGILLVRLTELQVFYGGKYRQLADENRIKKEKIVAVRGRILDRNGKIMAQGMRNYPSGEIMGHVVGYLGEISREEVGLLRPAGADKPDGGKFDPGDAIGRSGVEETWDETLRGRDGGRLIEVDNSGGVVRELGNREPEDGRDVSTNLDLDLQATAYAAMASHRGAVVVSNPKTGEVLAMVSTPGFDPNTLSAQYPVLSTQENRPLLNRAIGGLYPPGSTFKMVTTIAALSSGKLTPEFTYQDTGVVTVGSYRYTNWYFTQSGGVEGVVGWKRALARSTDTFFYKVGENIGVQTMLDWATKMGVGQKTGIDILGEVSGLVPDPEWKERTKKEKWFLGDTFIMAIGQGDLLASPAQINVMTNIIASGGKKCRLRLVGTGECPFVEVGSDVLSLVHEGMVAACSSGGTAYPFFEWNTSNKDKIVACKTGTAEFVLPSGKTGTHAWLTAYAPVGDPTISVTALVESGGEGSRTAAPVVRKIMAKYFGVEDTFDYKEYLPKGE